MERAQGPADFLLGVYIAVAVAAAALFERR